MKEIYYIHDNYGKPLKVIIGNGLIDIHKIKNNNDNDNDENTDDKYEIEPFLQYVPQRIFIGKSPLNAMTEFSGGHGSYFDGNSILLKMSENKYIFIGKEIISFQSYVEIVEYVSPVGNNDVSYPYAIDTDGKYYLLVEDVVVKHVPLNHDPYDYYYKLCKITPELGRDPPTEPAIKNFQDIERFYIGLGKYTMTYSPNASQNYDRLRRNIGRLYIKKINGIKYELTKEDYIKLMNDYAQIIEVEPLDIIEMVQDRLI